ncbi:MAG: hypothetical protein ACR2OF_03355, partial [Hyphomicrobium sp.]
MTTLCRPVRKLMLGFATLLAAGQGAAFSARAEPPQRIVSLTVCTDQLLLDLAPRKRIAAVSYLATDAT